LQCSADQQLMDAHGWVCPPIAERVGAFTCSPITGGRNTAVTVTGRLARKTRVVACACACDGQKLTKYVLVLQAEDADGDEEKEDERDVRPSFLGV
jgi:hypothetical protein